VTALVGEGVAYNLTMIDRLWTMFALGIGAFVFRHRIRLSWVVLAVLTLASAWALRAGIGFHIDSLFSAYAVLCLGFLTARRRSVSGDWPDYSYGMYIYAFPVMIGLQTLFAFDHHAPLAIANALATLPLAALSWHLVEKPVLNRVARARKRESVAAPVA
jgi:peptidoglycan/LPS O-acetylase OafA/YrhL